VGSLARCLAEAPQPQMLEWVRRRLLDLQWANLG